MMQRWVLLLANAIIRWLISEDVIGPDVRHIRTYFSRNLLLLRSTVFHFRRIRWTWRCGSRSIHCATFPAAHSQRKKIQFQIELFRDSRGSISLIRPTSQASDGPPQTEVLIISFSCGWGGGMVTSITKSVYVTGRCTSVVVGELAS